MRLIFTLFLLISFGTTQAQNLVPNPGFEEKHKCPNNRAQFTHYCKDWYQYSSGTPDYYNKCSPPGIVKPPRSEVGYQEPVNGDAYIGLLMNLTGADYKEYVAAKIPSLVNSMIYEVSMYISLADSSEMATNDLGVYFFKDAPDTAVGGTLPVIPQISYSRYGIFKDTANWVRVVDTFVADSAYTHMVIGGFHRIDTMQLVPTGMVNLLLEKKAYYFIDSVTMVALGPSPVDPFGTPSVTSTLIAESLCLGDSALVAYSVWDGNYKPDNVFSIQLSNGSGGFTNPRDIGNTKSFKSGTITATIPYDLSVDSTYHVRLVSSNPADTTVARSLNVNDQCGLIDIPTAFSPNGDGNNDVLFVCGNNVAQVDLRIYNRWGHLIFETSDINKGWNGTFKGQQQEIDVYGYSLSGVLKNGKTVQKQGNISLTR